ncbi:MAG TPA: RidA family protein [Thermoleophilaceae bacterium]|jgi:enamine deaminase RidA (YjgF/YER057c/UK114 family)
MHIELRNIEGMSAPSTYHHVSIARGRRLIHMAGQVGTGDDGALADGLAAQAEQAMRNVERALRAAGATPNDLAKLTVYVVDWDQSKLQELGAGLFAAAEEPWPQVPITLIGVAALFEPGMLIEIEGVAVADGD